MAEERATLKVTARTELGSSTARRLRRDGFVPGVLYGHGEPQPFYVGERELRRVLTGGHGLHAMVDVVVDGNAKPHHAVLKDFQLHPIRSNLVHVDLHEVRLDRAIQSQVAIELVGNPAGVVRGGLLQQVMREVTVEALPMEMLDRVEVDVSALDIGDSVRVADIAVQGGATIIDDPEAIVANVTAARRVIEEGEVEEGAEAEMGGAAEEAQAPSDETEPEASDGS